MGYIKTPIEVNAYDSFYRTPIDTNGQSIGVTFTTTREFARSVVPPCFEVPETPAGTVYLGAFTEKLYGQYTEEEEEGAVISLDVLYEGKPGTYTLTVWVTRDQSIATAREIWGMPKKLGDIHSFGNGKMAYAFGRRKGAEIRIDTILGPEQHPDSDKIETSNFYELRPSMKGNGGLRGPPILNIYESDVRTFSSREGDLMQTKVSLKGTHDDPVDSVPILSLTSAFARGTVALTKHVREVEMDASLDWRPYLYGRFYDDWAATAQRKAGTEIVRHNGEGSLMDRN